MATTTEQIKKLRELTGAGVLDAKRTLESYNGDFDKALAVLKEKALKEASKKSTRAARQGRVETYVHKDDLTEGRLGVMLEINCETDFVANTPDFKTLAHDLALQIAATNPKFVSPDDIPADVLAEQKRIYAEAAAAEGKKPEIIEKIVQGKIDTYFKEACLLRQAFIRDDTMTIHDLIQSKIGILGENIVVRRFTRYELGA